MRRLLTALLAPTLVLATVGAPRAQEPAEVFMWVGANRLLDDEPAVLENMLRFAARHSIVPYSSGMADPERLERFLSLCDELGIRRTWIEIGVPRRLTDDATVEEFVSDPARREPVLALYRELARVYRAHSPELARVTIFDEAPLGAFPGPGGIRDSYLREMRAFRAHGAEAFAMLKAAFEAEMPGAEVGLFLHHPHNASPAMAGEYSFVEELVEGAAALDAPPDFLFSDVYRGYFMRGYGYEATNAYIRDVVAHTAAVGERFGIPAYQLGQAHTIKLGYTPSRWEIDGNIDAMLEGGADAVGWYWPNYAATDQTAPGEAADVHVSFDPFVPNAWGRVGPAGSMYGTSRDRWTYAYLRALEATGRLDPEGRFDLWIYGHDLDHAEHRVSLRDRDGEWEVLGWINPQRDAAGYEEGTAAAPIYSYDGRWGAVIFHALERSRFLVPSRRGHPTLTLRIETIEGSDGSELAAMYALPYRPTRSYLTEGEAVRLIEERPRWIPINALAWHVRPRSLALDARGTVELHAADLSVAEPARERLNPERWRWQGLRQVLEPWEEHARDEEYGAFHTFLTRDWTPYDGTSKYPGMVARHLFSYSVGYLLSGDPVHLERAREIHRWLMEHGWDDRYGLFYDEVDREGRVVRESKDLFMQLYALTGLAMYYTVTRHPEVMETLERSTELLAQHAWDDGHGGYFRSLNRDLSVAESEKAVSPQLAPVSGYLLYLYQATGDARWRERAEWISRLALDRMRDPGTGWLLERFDREWRVVERPNRPGTAVNTGHNAEIAWSALRLHLLTGAPEWRDVGVEMGRRILERAFLPGPGFWSKGFDLQRPDSLDATAPWWIQAYGNLLSLYLYRTTGEDRFLDAFLRGAEFWDRHVIDDRYGGAVLSVDSTGAVVRGAKAVRTKTSYHSMEHALLAALYTGLWASGEPVALHFRVEDPSPDEPLRTILVEDPDVRLTSVEVNGRTWTDFDAASGLVRLPAEGPARVRVVLEGTPVGTTREDPHQMLDLVVHGDGLDPDALTLMLRTDPDAGDRWERIDARPLGSPENTSLVFPGISAARYLGGDIRENHMTVRLVTTTEDVESAVRAIYAMPSLDDLTEPAVAELDRRIRERPLEVEREALAALALPRPRRLQPGAPWTEHVEAPARGRKPGVVEVEWLEILFRNRR